MRAPQSEFGKRIRAYRKRYHLTCTDLAQAVGVHPSYIGQIEAGANKRGPSVAVVYRLAAVMGENADELLRLAGKVDRERVLQENEMLRRRVAELEKQLGDLPTT